MDTTPLADIKAADIAARAEIMNAKSSFARSVLVPALDYVAPLYGPSLETFLADNFIIHPHTPDEKLPSDSGAIFPVRLFAFLFTYRYFTPQDRSLVKNLGEKTSNTVKKRGGKHGCNTPYVAHAINQLHPELQSSPVFDRLNGIQTTCYTFLEAKPDSEFLNKEIPLIWNDKDPRGLTTHFLQPCVDSYLSILATRKEQRNKKNLNTRSTPQKMVQQEDTSKSES